MASEPVNLTSLFLVGQLHSRVKKPLLGGERYLLAFDLFTLGQHCFSQAAVVGAARPTWIDSLAKAWLTDPEGSPEPFWNFTREEVAKRKAHFGSLEGLSLFDFFLAPEVATMGFTGQPSLALTALEKDKGKKVTLDMANGMLNMWTAEGLVFGANNPDLTKVMFERAVNIDPTSPAEAHAAGVRVPATMEHLSFEEQARDLVEPLPELLPELGDQ